MCIHVSLHFTIEAMRLKYGNDFFQPFEQWSNKISLLAENRSVYAAPVNYQTSATVRQLGRTGGDIKSYKFEGIYPVNISAIDLAWDSNDAAEEYTVEFAVQYWEPIINDTDVANAKEDTDNV